MKVILLCGAGANGKTSLVRQMIHHYTSFGIQATGVYSNTRETFARLGYSNEQVGLMQSPEDQLKLQWETLNDFCKLIVMASHRGGNEYMVCDRCPLDYLGYVIQSIPSASMQDLDRRKAVAYESLNILSEQHKVFMVYLPTVPPWKVEDDGYRHAPAAKNLAWGYSVKGLLQEYKHPEPSRRPTRVYADQIPSFVGAISSEERAVVLRNEIEFLS